jgi:hypothetical protein
MTRPFLCLALLLVVSTAYAQPTGQEMPNPLANAAASLIQVHDRNGDHQLNADECPALFRDDFATIDINHDGYIQEGELKVALARRPVRRGKLIAQEVLVVADDFVVEVYHNGKKVPLEARELLREIHGATTERVHIRVHEGDWLVFHVVNNRLRWNGASYFAAAGVLPGAPGFVSSLTASGWSSSDDPVRATAFIAAPEDAFRPVRPIERKWEEGDSIMNEMVPGWSGSAIWGEAASTWIKYVAPAASAVEDESPKK